MQPPSDMSDNVSFTARLLITAATLAYGLGPFLVDMNKTHLLHPAWPGHARLHLMWSAISQLVIAGIALWLLWAEGADPLNRSRLAVVIGLAATSGFWGALVLRRFFGGTLHDEGGVPPIAGRFDGNIVAVLAIDGLLVAGLFSIS